MPTFRYRYAADNPPSPAVLVSIAHPNTNARVESIWGLVDTGADQTVIPESLVDELDLVKLDEELICGFDGQPQVLQTQTVLLQVRDFLPIELEVLASPHVKYPIIGRDVLNRYTLTLDGRQRMLTVTDE